MKSLLPLLLLQLVSGHYIFPAIIREDGTPTADWEYVRPFLGSDTKLPLTDVTSLDLRCNINGAFSTTSTFPTTAGTNLTFRVSPSLYHPGTLTAYLSPVPPTTSASTWTGAGASWFKIFQSGPLSSPSGTSGNLVFPYPDTITSVSFPLPLSLPNGEYLFRVEHIALQAAAQTGGAQFYVSCAQIRVSGGSEGGKVEPGPKVEIPGVYGVGDPGILVNFYVNEPTYTFPGPPVWTG